MPLVDFWKSSPDQTLRLSRSRSSLTAGSPPDENPYGRNFARRSHRPIRGISDWRAGTSNQHFTVARDVLNLKPRPCCRPVQVENQNLMKLAIFFAAAASLALIGNGLADQYDTLAAQGYRWVNVNGPYACTSEQHVEGLVAHRTDARELEVVQNIQCYYLIPGTIVQVIKEDPAQGMTEMRVAGRPRYLWTYTRFLSKRPIQDTYGVIQTPQNSGLSPGR
jgi:hypothetical protein